MKTVSGIVVDSNPVSLSKAAKILSKFASDDNGAPPAVLHYLMRASDAFAELVQLHKELRGSGSDRKSNSNSKSRRSGVKVEEEPLNSVGNYGGVAAARETEAGEDGERFDLEKVNCVVKKEGASTIGNSVDSKGMKKEKKKIKKELSEDGRSNGVKKEEIDPELRENGNVGGVEIEKKLSKKRKSREIGGDGEGTDSAKGKQNKKRKKVKSEVDD